MELKRTVMQGLSEISSLIHSMQTVSPSYRILMYHAVGGKVINDRKNIFSITPRLFEEHIKCLAERKRMAVVGLDSSHLKAEEGCLAITFDDGYKDNLFEAAPILEKYDFPYTVFVSTGYVKSNAKFFLSAKELRELSELPNATIGSHSVSHPSLVDCSETELTNELIYSKHYLEDITGKDIKTFAYPFGAVNQRVRDAVEEAGYSLGTTSYMHTNYSSQDQLMLSRTSVLGIDSVRTFNQKIRGDWDWYRYIQDYRET
jgi:peptidoglycan/xylan/chitin deacetylase (PgdA/CDA1 family)